MVFRIEVAVVMLCRSHTRHLAIVFQVSREAKVDRNRSIVENGAYVNGLYGEIELLIQEGAGPQGQLDEPGQQRLRQCSLPIGLFWLTRVQHQDKTEEALSSSEPKQSPGAKASRKVVAG